MPSNKKPKKKYRPKLRTALPINYRFSKDIEIKLSLIPHECLRNFKEGRQEESDWHVLAARINIGSKLTVHHFSDNEEAIAAMNLALESLQGVWARYRRLGKIGMTGEEYNHIATALNLTDEMQTLCTRRELDAALNETIEQAAVT